MDGSCLCSDGWTGGDCSVFDFNFVGEFTSRTIEFSDCTDASGNGSAPANGDDRYCFTNSDGNLSCQRLVLQLNQDNTGVFIDISTEIIGGIDFSQSTRFEGTYSTNDEVITFTTQGSNEVLTFTVTDDRSAIVWNISMRTLLGWMVDVFRN